MNHNSTKAILQTVIIQTGRLAKMADFYARGFELGEPAATGNDHLGFPLPNLYFGFDLVEDVPEPSGVVSLWFEVEDIEATFTRFEELQARIKYPPTKKPWGAILAALYDPDGNLFGISQRGANPEM
ncbi:MAG: VOC family protein [Chloroflexota bacterium]|nr:MAG: VOC family protein [Chloroflexota bacterium]